MLLFAGMGKVPVNSFEEIWNSVLVTFEMPITSG